MSMRSEQEHVAFNEVTATINAALTRYAKSMHAAIMGSTVDLRERLAQQDLIRHYSRADEETMQRLVDVCDQIDTRHRNFGRPADAMAAALELMKAGVSVEEIIDTHLTAAEQVADGLHCTLVDAALLVAQASAQFRLDARSLQFLPGFVKLVKDT
jgi:hypothetical protein